MEYEQLKLKNQLCFRLYAAARLTVGAYHPHLDPLGITYPQYLVLLVLWEQAKHIPECLSASIMDKMGSVEELAAMVPALDKLIEGLSER